MKYHLLLKEILRHTPNDHPDQQHLEEAVSEHGLFFLWVDVWQNVIEYVTVDRGTISVLIRLSGCTILINFHSKNNI